MKHPVVDYRERLAAARASGTGVMLSWELAAAIDTYLPETDYRPDLWQGRREALLLREDNRGGHITVTVKPFRLPLDDQGVADETKIPETMLLSGMEFERLEPRAIDKPPHFTIRYLRRGRRA